MAEELRHVDIRHASHMGELAARTGLPITSCPYAEDNPVRHYWIEAYERQKTRSKP